MAKFQDKQDSHWAGDNLHVSEPAVEYGDSGVVYGRLRGIVIGLVCIALGFFTGRDSVRNNWLNDRVVEQKPPVVQFKPHIQIIQRSQQQPDYIDPPRKDNPFNLPKPSPPPLPRPVPFNN